MQFLTFDRIIKGIVYTASVIIILAVLIGACNRVFGQSINFRPHLEMNMWAEGTQNYQHTMLGETEARARWGILELDGFIGIRWYGSSEAKIPSSFLNTEASKVLHRFHGVNLGLWITDYLMIGGTVRRNAVNHIWTHKRSRENRHNYFPGSWQVGRAGCVDGDAPNWPKGSPQCPSLGYEDIVAPYIRLSHETFELSVMLPGYQWKSLTFPWNNLRYEAEYSFHSCANERLCNLIGNTWTVRSQGSFFGPATDTAKMTLFRNLGGRVSLGVSVGREWNPDWRFLKLDRLSLVLSVTGGGA